jgi:CheY-like chemotaxis protein
VTRSAALGAWPAARILIVDDEADNRALLEIILNWEGFLTLSADSGEEALTAAAEHLPDLILLDLMMPGLDGSEVIARLNGNLATRNIPVVIISAMNDRVTRERVLSVGAVDFLSKPLDRAELCRCVRSILRQRSSGLAP